ncbi:phosphatase 2C-like domain-containing protein [Schizophyllum commune]
MFRPFLRHAFRMSAAVARPVPLPRRSGHALILGISIAAGASYLSVHQRLHADTNEQRPSDDEWAKRDPQGLPPPGELTKPALREAEDPGDILRSRVVEVESHPDLGIANWPNEDQVSRAIAPLPGNQHWVFLGIFDGHNGNSTSMLLSLILPTAVLGALADLYSKHARLSLPTDVDDGEEHQVDLPLEPLGPVHPPPEEIDQTIKEAFLRVDDDIVHWAAERALAGPPDGRAQDLLAPALSGSCALLGFLETESRELHMALTGDSRAVLGRPVVDAQGKRRWKVHELTQDQNAHNEREMARMEGEHPGETIGANGRVMGWGMARAFGDAAYKWSRELQKRLFEDYLCDYPRSNVKTPPYFTAEPEITTTQVRPGDVLVMASDGLWDCLTNEEVVGLVGLWLEKHSESEVHHPQHEIVSSAHESTQKDVIERDDLPVVDMKADHTKMYPWWHAQKRFINVDDTVTAHLARNALGGANVNLTSALLHIAPPRTRRYRDDISMIVVLF